MSRRTADDSELPIMRDIVARIDSLSELINDLMLFARPRAPRLHASELRPLVNDAITIVRRDPGAGQIAFTVGGSEITAEVDAEMIRASILNLLLNAVQAMAGDDGRIQVTLRRHGGIAEIAVHDSGPGIPQEIRDQVLEPFFTTKARGGGLGLPIAKRTAEMHGGTLTLDCPSGGGTIVTLSLPIDARTTKD
jgi:signal transduction histidine kinase